MVDRPSHSDLVAQFDGGVHAAQALDEADERLDGGIALVPPRGGHLRGGPAN